MYKKSGKWVGRKTDGALAAALAWKGCQQRERNEEDDESEKRNEIYERGESETWGAREKDEKRHVTDALLRRETGPRLHYALSLRPRRCAPSADVCFSLILLVASVTAPLRIGGRSRSSSDGDTERCDGHQTQSAQNTHRSAATRGSRGTSSSRGLCALLRDAAGRKSQSRNRSGGRCSRLQ